MTLTEQLRLNVKQRIAKKLRHGKMRVSRVFEHVQDIVQLMRQEGAVEYIRAPDGNGGYYQLTDLGKSLYLDGGAQ